MWKKRERGWGMELRLVLDGEQAVHNCTVHAAPKYLLLYFVVVLNSASDYLQIVGCFSIRFNIN
jgi:hypothetical protein